MMFLNLSPAMTLESCINWAILDNAKMVSVF